MVPGGVTEVVWHFAGYLKIIDDIARDRIVFDESPFRNVQDDYVAKLPSYDTDPDVDVLDSHGLLGPEPLVWDDLHASRVWPVKILMPPPLRPDLDDDASGALPRLSWPAAPGGGGSGYDIHITVQYQDAGDQTLLHIHQVNALSDDDSLLVLPDGPLSNCDEALIAAQANELTLHTENILQRMADEANDQIPKEWWIPQNGTGITDFADAHAKELVSLSGTPGMHSVEPGYYLNGVLQDPAPTPPDQVPPPDPAPAPDFGHDLGQWAEAGGNNSWNASLIVDLSESGRSMIVMGDYFKTNAIFQTNSTMDHDHVDGVGGQGVAFPPGADQATNIADFVQHSGIYASLTATFAGPHWNVDVVDGNYYDVHTVVQMNYLSDNDIVVQQSSDSHYVALSGGNELGNLAQVFDGSIHYDLIIVAGAYHGMNVIFQNNILLNNDFIKMIADGVDPSQSAISGQNELTNTATIENYGDDNFKPMNENLNSVVTAVGNGVTTLDPSYGTFLDGSGGTFNVLYVKGDYYDLNAIWQTNVTSDVNVILQVLGAPSAGAQALHPDGVETQSVTSGKDVLSNDAAIVDVGATNTYVNGHVYGDTILVQANLLPTDKDHTLTHDAQTLVPELVAFVNESQGEAAAVQPVTIAPTHDDAIANVLH
jgi:hypothetical protein